MNTVGTILGRGRTKLTNQQIADQMLIVDRHRRNALRSGDAEALAEAEEELDKLEAQLH